MAPPSVFIQRSASERHNRIDKNARPRLTTADCPVKNLPTSLPQRDSYIGTVTACIDKGNVGTRPEHYKLGEIIRIPHVHPNLDPKAKSAESHVGWIESTGPVTGKFRPAVIVGIYASGLTCLPVLTPAAGEDLTDVVEEDCLRLRTQDDYCPEWQSVKQTRYLVVRSACPGISDPAYVDLTRPIAVSFRYPIRRMTGLKAQSCNRLRQIYLIWLQKGMVPLGEQRAFVESRMREIEIQ